MDLNAILASINGPLGALVLLVLLVFALATRRYFVLACVYESAEERIRAIDEENAGLNQAVIELTRQNASLEAQTKAIRAEMERMRQQIEHLSGSGSGAWE